MKLLMAIVSSDDSRDVLDKLTKAGFRATVISTTGGADRGERGGRGGVRAERGAVRPGVRVVCQPAVSTAGWQAKPAAPPPVFRRLSGGGFEPPPQVT